jgi:hypothetical protein
MAKRSVTSCARLQGVLPGTTSESELEVGNAIARSNPSHDTDVPHAGGCARRSGPPISSISVGQSRAAALERRERLLQAVDSIGGRNVGWCAAHGRADSNAAAAANTSSSR